MSIAPAPLTVTDLVVDLGGTRILDGVSCAAQPGRILAVLGPNGAGKSTLLKAMLGLVPRCGGRIDLGDRALDTCPLHERGRRLAYVPQHSELAARLTVDEVVALGRFPHRGGRPGLGAVDREAIDGALLAADIVDLRHRRFDTLSGGEAARVLIARGLATAAPVLLLDEPTASLDIGHALDCLALLRALADDGRAIVTVLHDLDQAHRHADDAILLHRGRTVAVGPAADIVHDAHLPAVYGVRLQPGGAFGFERVTEEG